VHKKHTYLAHGLAKNNNLNATPVVQDMYRCHFYYILPSPHMITKNALLVTAQGLLLTSLSFATLADQVILDDLIVDGSQCVGSACTDNEAFSFDTILYKSDDPSVRFQDTSSSASFPTSDWEFGFSDENSTVIPYFYLKDLDSDANLLILQSGNNGGIAIGAHSTLEDNSISVGNADTQRKVVYVANGVADSDAANMAQFNAFTTTAEANVAGDIVNINSDISELQTSLTSLQSRLETLATRIDGLTP